MKAILKVYATLNKKPEVIYTEEFEGPAALGKAKAQGKKIVEKGTWISEKKKEIFYSSTVISHCEIEFRDDVKEAEEKRVKNAMKIQQMRNSGFGA